MKIAILSDSHQRVDLTKMALEHLLTLEIEHIIHAGDLEIEQNLMLLQNSGIEYTSVFGNNDFRLVNLQHKYNIHQEPHYFKLNNLNNLKFKLMHMPFFLSADADIVISGHTHIEDVSFNNGTLFINPGEICAREKPQSSYIVLEITDTQYIVTTYINDFKTIKNRRKVYDRD
jgi:putative phosphoesterase